MSSLMETGNVEEAAKTLHDLKPQKRYTECMIQQMSLL